jgi:hypothetical protein
MFRVMLNVVFGLISLIRMPWVGACLIGWWC